MSFDTIIAWAGNNTRLVLAILNTLLLPLLFILFGRLIEFLNSLFIGISGKFIGNKMAVGLHNYAFYIGTIHHELAHALMALVTGANVTRITLIPKGNTLGSVQYQPRGNAITKAIQRTLASTAPVYLGTVSIFLLITYILPKCTENWHIIVFWYLVVSIFFHMNLSQVDVKGALSGLPICLLVLGVIFYFTQWNPVQNTIALVSGIFHIPFMI